MRRPSSQLLRAGLPLLLVVVFAFEFAATRRHAPAHTTKSVDLSQLIVRVEARPGSLKRVVFDPTSLLVTATLVGGDSVEAHYPSDQSALTFQNLLERKKVDFAAKAPSHPSALTTILESLLPILLLAGVWIFVMRRMRGGAGGLGQMMSFGKHKAARLAPDLPTIGFKDVAGVDEAVEELQEIKEFLADPRRFQALGARSGNARLHRRRTRQPDQRGCSPRRPSREDGHRPGRARGGRHEGDRWTREEGASFLGARTQDHRLPRDGSRSGRPLPRAHRPGPQDLDRPPRPKRSA
jgi:hypothetical protein